MFLRIALFAMMAVGLTGFGAVAWISTWPPTRAVTADGTTPAAPQAKVSVLVAARYLRAGAFLKAEDIRALELPVTQVPVGSNADTVAIRNQLQGAMIRRSVAENQPVLADDVLRPGDHGFLAAVLEPGKRAMTVSLNEVTSDWALIWPGDHVDLILIQQFDEANTLARRRIAAETVMTDVRIVAVDKQLVQGDTVDDAERKGPRMLTIEVSPEEAERLAIAIRIGKLTISLRSATSLRQTTARNDQGMIGSLSDATSVPPATVIWSGDVAHALGQPTKAPEPLVVRVFGGAEDSKEFKF